MNDPNNKENRKYLNKKKYKYIQGYQVVHSWLLKDVMKTVTEIIAIKHHDLQEV